MTYRNSEAYQRSCKVDPTTGKPIWPLPPMGKQREALEAEMQAAETSGKVTRLKRRTRA